MEISGRRAPPKRIGELLVAANVVRQEVLMEALRVAKNSQTPLGRVLMSIGEISEHDLEVAIYIQQLIRQGTISSDFGVKAINVSVKAKISVEETFRRLGFTMPEVLDSDRAGANELGELLVQAGLLNRDMLENIIWQSQENNLAIGRCMVLNRVITSNMLQSALTAQVLIRDGKITTDQAVNALKKAALKHQSIEQSLVDSGAFKPPDKESIKFGDLLSQAGIVTEGDKISAIEIGLSENQKIGEVLVNTGMISPSVVDESLRLQEMVNQGKLSGLQAAEILRQAHQKHVTIDAIIEERAARQDEIEKVEKIMQLLLQSSALSGDNFNRAQSLARQLNVPIAEIVLAKEMVDKKIIAAALEVQTLITDGLLKPNQSVTAIKMCIKTGLELHEVLKDLPSESELSQPEASKDGSSQEKKAGWLGNIWAKKKKD